MEHYKWYGHFEKNGERFVITEPETPRHWYNYFFNDDYVSFTSQVGFGEGFAQDDMGNRIPVLSNRNVFLSEDGQAWSVCGTSTWPTATSPERKIARVASKRRPISG